LAQRIWLGARAEHGFTHSYDSVPRFVRKALAKKAQSILGSSWSEPTIAATRHQDGAADKTSMTPSLSALPVAKK
jgi:hypothetical protein